MLETNSKLFLRWVLLIFPIQTVYIARTVSIAGSVSEQMTLAVFFTELLVLAAGAWYWFCKSRKFSAGIIFLLCYFFAVIFFAPDFWLASQTVRRFLEVAILFFLIRYYVKTENDGEKKMIFWLSLGFLFPAFLGIVQFFSQSIESSTMLGVSGHIPWEPGSSVAVTDAGRWLRAYGTFPHPNVLGGIAVLVISRIVYFFYFFGEAMSKKYIYFYCFTLILFSAVLVFSFSRAAWVAFGFLAVVSHWIIMRRIMFRGSNFSLAVFAATASFIVCIGLVWPLAISRFSFSETHEIRSVSERASGYADARGILKDHWFTGVGPGNYAVALQEKYPALQGWQLQPVHNVWILFFVEWGIVGSLIALWIARRVWSGIVGKPEFLYFIFFPFLMISILDHYWYTTWVGMAFVAVVFSSTVYPQQGSVEAKNDQGYPH